MPISEKELHLKHCALVNFSHAIGTIHAMPWYESLRLAEELAKTGKPTKDLTLLEVMKALETVKAKQGQVVEFPQIAQLRQVLAS